MDDLDADRLSEELARREARLGRPLVVVESTASTNDDAKRVAENGATSGSAFIANAQTHGRGRLGRSWHSPPGDNLYVSFVIRPTAAPRLDVRRAPLVTLAAGLAVADAIAPLVPRANVGLKWPNDVLVDDRKAAGILTEAHLGTGVSDWIVIGIGINVKTREFPSDIAARATSLALASDVEPDRGVLFVELACALSYRLGELHASTAPIIDAFAARDALRERSITVDGAPATALGIADDGALRVRRPDGTEARIVAGNVQLRTE
jgi:BirA family biotin operon repressor/biotin-[acetyl-CoA-carboxylase] ligase